MHISPKHKRMFVETLVGLFLFLASQYKIFPNPEKQIVVLASEFLNCINNPVIIGACKLVFIQVIAGAETSV